MFWWQNGEILKISKLGRGSRLGPNDNLFNSKLKGKRYIFCKHFSYSHDLNINKMSKRYFWRRNSETLKIQNFGRLRSVQQNDRYFRSYITQKSLIILYELPICLCFFYIRQWLNDSLGHRILKFKQTQILGVADCCSKAIIALCHTSKKHLERIHIIYYFFKEVSCYRSYFSFQFC